MSYVGIRLTKKEATTMIAFSIKNQPNRCYPGRQSDTPLQKAEEIIKENQRYLDEGELSIVYFFDKGYHILYEHMDLFYLAIQAHPRRTVVFTPLISDEIDTMDRLKLLNVGFDRYELTISDQDDDDYDEGDDYDEVDCDDDPFL